MPNYLYYNFVSSASGASGHDKISVAVCDTPTGRYEYLGYVRNPDGSVHNKYLMGDSAVMNDDGVIRLYTLYFDYQGEGMAALLSFRLTPQS